MPNTVGIEYKLRCVWNEMRWHCDQPEGSSPHIDAFLTDRRVRFVLRHIQNFCWTVERWLRRLTAKRSLPNFERPLPHFETSSTSADVDREKRRVFIDITPTASGDHHTGIQRVCRRLAAEGARTGTLIPVILDSRGRLRSLTSDVGALGIELRSGDIYVMLDLFWETLDAYLAFVKTARARGALIATCLYDVVPAIHPELCMTAFVETFPTALKKICAVTDIVFSISQATLDDLQTALPQLSDEGPSARAFFHFHLGADDKLGETDDDTTLPAALTDQKFFLSVGTVEPKKGYCLTLDAFDRLWASGHAINFAIIGKYGWCAESVRERVLHHPMLGKHLFWFQTASDAFLNAAYAQAYCFIQASVAEGFGIPVIEAARHGLPVIASDIDVFKEIAGDNLIYFKSEDAASLADQIEAAANERPVAKQWPVQTWQQATQDLYEKLQQAALVIEAKRQS